MPRKRTQAREIAVQLLYQYEVRRKMEDGSVNLEAKSFISENTDDPDVKTFCSEIYEGTLDSLETIDQLLSEVVDKWSIDRLAAVDLAILRLAVYELKEQPDVPSKVAINEAIELAKKFSTQQSSSFVNGILDRLLVLRGNEENNPSDSLWNFGSKPE